MDRLTLRLLLSLVPALAVAACGGTTEFQCQPECPAGYRCTESGCVTDLVIDMSAAAADLAPGCITACSGAAPYCNAKGLCAPCLEDSHCPVGQICKVLGSSSACISGCADDARCGGGAMKCCNGSCVDTGKDAANCGACGTACKGSNARNACQGGVCALGACNAGWGDCNGDAADGCETTLRADPKNCGACGMACSLAHGIAGCAGTCYLRACDFGWDDCDGKVETGCEASVVADARNCGACGNVCVGVPHAKNNCINGSCQLTSCDPGFADCNNTLMDGCEVTVASDVQNCGACGNKCAFGLVCNQGMCTCPQCNLPNAKSACVNLKCAVSSCNANWGDCDGQPQNGCERALSADAMNCGACGNACAQGLVCVNGSCTCPNCMRPNARTACRNNQCVLDQCFAGFGNCDGNDANGCEVDLGPDANNCGACGNVCPKQTPFCQAGKCTNVPSCHGPFSVDQVISLDGNFVKNSDNFHPQSMEWDPVNQVLVFALQAKETLYYVDTNGTTVNSTGFPKPIGQNSMHYTQGLTLDEKYIYVVDYTCNANCTDIVRYDRNGQYGMQNGINASPETAAYGGYPVLLVGSTIYRGKIINNTYDWTGINEIRVSDIGSIDNIQRTLATNYINRGIGDMAWDGSAIWVLGYSNENNPNRAVDLWRVDPNTGANLESYAAVFTANQPLRPAGLAYGNNSLWVFSYPEAGGTNATVTRMSCK